MKYELNLELYDEIDVETSYYELSSVGRVYVNLTKTTSPVRWVRLLATKERLPNMKTWWEMHEKYDSSLRKHTKFDSDEGYDDDFDEELEEI